MDTSETGVIDHHTEPNDVPRTHPLTTSATRERHSHLSSSTIGWIGRRAWEARQGVSFARRAVEPTVAMAHRIAQIIGVNRAESGTSKGHGGLSHLMPGDVINFSTPHGAGGFALFTNGEYVQSDRQEETTTVMWSTEESAEQIVRDVRAQLGDENLGDAEVTFTAGDIKIVPLADLEQLVEQNPVSVIWWKDAELEVGWRAAVAKLPQTPLRGECVVTAPCILPRAVQSLLETTGSTYVVKEGTYALERLDVVSSQ